MVTRSHRARRSLRRPISAAPPVPTEFGTFTRKAGSESSETRAPVPAYSYEEQLECSIDERGGPGQVPDGNHGRSADSFGGVLGAGVHERFYAVRDGASASPSDSTGQPRAPSAPAATSSEPRAQCPSGPSAFHIAARAASARSCCRVVGVAAHASPHTRCCAFGSARCAASASGGVSRSRVARRAHSRAHRRHVVPAAGASSGLWSHAGVRARVGGQTLVHRFW